MSNTDKKILVVYASKYGTTRQYAEWIAEALGADVARADTVRPEDLPAYDTVVYGGGLYAGGIAGARLVASGTCKRLVVFTVGLADPSQTDYSAILNKNFSPELLAKIRAFHLRGGIDYKRLGPVHKVMMSMMKRMTQKKPVSGRDASDDEFLRTYGAQVDFLDKRTIEPLVAYVNKL